MSVDIVAKPSNDLDELLQHWLPASHTGAEVNNDVDTTSAAPTAHQHHPSLHLGIGASAADASQALQQQIADNRLKKQLEATKKKRKRRGQEDDSDAEERKSTPRFNANAPPSDDEEDSKTSLLKTTASSSKHHPHTDLTRRLIEEYTDDKSKRNKIKEKDKLKKQKKKRSKDKKQRDEQSAAATVPSASPIAVPQSPSVAPSPQLYAIDNTATNTQPSTIIITERQSATAQPRSMQPPAPQPQHQLHPSRLQQLNNTAPTPVRGAYKPPIDSKGPSSPFTRLDENGKKVRVMPRKRSKQKNLRKDTRPEHLKPSGRQQMQASSTSETTPTKSDTQL